MTEDNQSILNVGIGNKEPVTLKPKKCIVQSVRLEQKKKEDKIVGQLIVLTCKHPEHPETIDLSNVKILGVGEKIKLFALWFNKDDDGKLTKNSAASKVLRFYDVANFGDLVGKEVETTVQSETNSFLCIKAY